MLVVGVCSRRVSYPADAKVKLPNCDITSHQLVQQQFTFADSDDETEGKWQCYQLCQDTDDEKADDENPLGFVHGPWQQDTHVTCRFLFPHHSQVKRKRDDRTYSVPGYLNRKFKEAGMPSQSSS